MSGLTIYFFEIKLDNYLFYVAILFNSLFWGFFPEILDGLKKACIAAGSIFKQK